MLNIKPFLLFQCLRERFFPLPNSKFLLRDYDLNKFYNTILKILHTSSEFYGQIVFEDFEKYQNHNSTKLSPVFRGPAPSFEKS